MTNDKLTRRALMRVSSAAALSPLTAALAEQPGAESKVRPNILIIISDQFRADNLGVLGRNPMNLTPHLDAMARRGTLFRWAMANQPVCAPARGCLFTGQYPERHGVWKNGPGLRTDAVTLATELRRTGYTANYFGKWHLAPNSGSDPASWGAVAPEYRGGFLDKWEAANVLELISHGYAGSLFDNDGKPLRFENVYRAEFVTERVNLFLRERQEKPFLVVASYLEVHHQNDSDKFVPPREMENRYANPFVPQDLRPLPGTWPSQLADYDRCVTAVDDQVGALQATLREQGLDNNTIVLFVSDHGCHFRTRNTEYKRSPHDSSLHVPLVVCGPGFDRSLEVSELVSQVDITPSLLSAAGVAVPAGMQGRSFLPLLEGHTNDWRNEVYFDMSEFVTGRGLRTPRWTYAAAAPKTAGWKPVPASDRYVEYVLYDNLADPFQHVNLAGHAPLKEVSELLRGRLLERIAEAGGAHPVIEPCHYPYS